MAFPATINASSYAWSLHKNGNHGPWLSGGNLHVLLVNTTTNLVQCYRSTNDGDTWSTYGDTIAIHATAGGETVTGALSGTTLTCAYFPTSGWVTYRTLDLTSGSPTWSAAAATVGSGNFVTVGATLPSTVMGWQVFVRSDGSRVLVTSNSSTVMGADYARCRVHAWAVGGASGTVYEVSTGSTTADGTQVHFVTRSAIQASDRIHVFYTEHTSGAFTGLRHRSFESDNSFGTLATIDSTPAGAAADTTRYTCGLGATWDDSGTLKIVQPYVDADGSLAVARATTGTNPTFSFQTVSGTSTNDPEFTSANPGACAVDSTTVYLFWPDDTTLDIYWSKSTAGAAWDSPLEYKDAVAVAGISIGKLTSVLGVVYDDGGTVKYDQYSLGPPPPQDAPEIRGRPFGLSGDRGMRQLLAR